MPCSEDMLSIIPDKVTSAFEMHLCKAISRINGSRHYRYHKGYVTANTTYLERRVRSYPCCHKCKDVKSTLKDLSALPPSRW